MLVDFQVVEHKQQRYETVGDWFWCTGRDCKPDGPIGTFHITPKPADQNTILHIRVSKMSDPRYELLVFHHELTEALLCREAGVTAEMVDAWDEKYEAHRRVYMLETAPVAEFFAPCGCIATETSEPGDDPHAPYHEAHLTATVCEVRMANVLGVDWDKYNAEVESL